MMKRDFVKQQMPFSTLTTFIFFTILLLPILYFIWFILFDKTERSFGFLSVVFYLLSAVILTFWSFLREPVVVINRYEMEALAKTRPEIVEKILSLARMVNLKHTPIVLRIPSSQSPSIFTFGTWKYQYIAISDKALEAWSDEQTFNAVMLHEFGHLASGDIWKTGWSLQYVKWLAILSLSLLMFNLFNTTFTVSVSSILINVGLLMTILAISLAVRALFRMRELAADEFALNFSYDMSLLHVVLAQGKMGGSGQNNFLFENLYDNSWLKTILDFHPDKTNRLWVIQGKGDDIFAQKIPELLFIAGLLIGEFTSFYADIALVYKIIIGGVLFFAPIFLSLGLASSNIKNLTNRAFFLFESIIKLITGVALAFIIQVLPNSFFEDSPIDGKSFLIYSPMGLYHYVSLFWDTFFILVLILPVILFIVVWASDLATSVSFEALHIKRPIIIPWLIQMPFFIFLHLEWQNWSMGNSFSLEDSLFFVISWPIWIMLFYIFFRNRSFKETSATAHKDSL